VVALDGAPVAETFDALPAAHLLLDTALVVVAANRAFCSLTGLGADDLLGRDVFAALPPGASAVDGSGSNPVTTALARTIADGSVQVVPPLRCSGGDGTDGGAGARWWSVTSAPVQDAGGRTRHVVVQVQESAEDGPAAARASAHRLARLVEVALRLTSAESPEDVERTVVGAGLRLLGADGGGIVTPAPQGGWRLTSSSAAGTVAAGTYAWMPEDSPIPAVHAARTGERVLLPTREAGLAFDPAMAGVHEVTGRLAWALLPLTVEHRTLGSLMVAWTGEHAFAADEVDLLEAFAVQCATALDRIAAARVRAEASASVHRMAETLQLSLLSRPVVRDGLTVAVRYQAAQRGAQVGGDFHDAFETRAGGTVLVVGDVSGHDQHAAATMSQIRNMLRGIAFDADDRPAHLVSQLDQAIAGMQLDTLATAVLVVVEPPREGVAVRRARWVNAGHLPPLLHRAAAATEVLDPAHDLLLGLDPATSRHEHTVDLSPGDTLVLYTDGLVERRGGHLDDGIAWLRSELDRASHDPETCCDELLAALGTRDREDDAALLVMTVAPGMVPADPATEPEEHVVPADLRFVRDARRVTAACCRRAGLDEDLTDTAVLLTSELVTNAIVHGRSEARLRVHATPGGVRVEVGDDNDRAPVLQPRDDDALTGRGLSLLELTATTWGVQEAPVGKVVWFSLRAG